MLLLPSDIYKIQLPEMFQVKQKFNDEHIDKIEEVIHKEFTKPMIKAKVKPNMQIAVLVGSRGICNLQRIVKSVGAELHALGAKPFIVPAMGSHGGGTAVGQEEILAGYGITNSNVGMPIRSSMEVDEIGVTSDGVHICVDRLANNADLIVPIGRVKPHTDFKAPIESGLCKMLTIGLGKHEGCSRLHQRGFVNFPHLLPKAAEIVIKNTKVGFGLAIIENGYDKTYALETVPAENILQREPELLKIARKLMPSLMFKRIDVLVISEIGKDVSGAGMDPNITGRTTKGQIQNFAGPLIQRIVVESISKASHGNACGIGLADYILSSCEQQIDKQATAINSIGSGNPEAGRIPIVVETEREAILCALRTAIDVDYENLKLVKIKNTLALSDIMVSKALLAEVQDNPLQIVCKD